jgi:hypothetical protein
MAKAMADVGGPREPRHDLHCKSDGQAAYDVLTHFQQRWRKATRWHKKELIQMNRIPCILSRSANAPPEGYPTCDKWQWTKHLACSGTPPGSTSLSLCCILKPLHVEHNWVLNNGSIVQGVLRFWSTTQFCLSFWAKCRKWCDVHRLLYSNLSTKMSNMCFDPYRFRIQERFPWHILFLPNACGCGQLQLPCATSQKEDHENLIKIYSDN